MAKVVLQKVVADAGQSSLWQIDSAGTHALPKSERADPRADAALQRRGYAVPKHKSRGVQPSDFENFDLLLAMDSDNLASLQRRCPVQHQGKLRLFLAFVPQLGVSDVPDPYYSNAQGFDRVLDLCESGATGLFDHFRHQTP